MFNTLLNLLLNSHNESQQTMVACCINTGLMCAVTFMSKKYFRTVFEQGLVNPGGTEHGQNLIGS